MPNEVSRVRVEDHGVGITKGDQAVQLRYNIESTQFAVSGLS